MPFQGMNAGSNPAGVARYTRQFKRLRRADDFLGPLRAHFWGLMCSSRRKRRGRVEPGPRRSSQRTRNPAMIHRPRRSRPCDSGLSLAIPSGWESDADIRCLLVHLGAALSRARRVQTLRFIASGQVRKCRDSAAVHVVPGTGRPALPAVHADKPGRRLRWPRSAECTTMVRTWRPHELARP